MCCIGKWVAAVLLAGAATLAGFHFASARAAQPQEGKPVDLTALRDAIEIASERGVIVGEIVKALDAFEKSPAGVKPGVVTPELRALRDAVEAAARKGEDVEAISKELGAVEMAVAGKSRAKPKPMPAPEPDPVRPNPPPPAFPNFPNLQVPNAGLDGLGGLGGFGGLGGGIDVQGFNKAMELRMKALELLLKNPRDGDARKLLAEANDMMLKAAGAGAGAGNVAPAVPNLFDAAPAPSRPRLGITMERVPAVAVQQLGLEPNTGIVVATVIPGSVAEKGGLQANDIVIEFAGKPVTDDTDDFARRVREAKSGEKVDLVILRKGKKVEVKGLELPDTGKPAAEPKPAAPQLGLPNNLPLDPAKMTADYQRQLMELMKQIEQGK